MQRARLDVHQGSISTVPMLPTFSKGFKPIDHFNDQQMNFLNIIGQICFFITIVLCKDSVGYIKKICIIHKIRNLTYAFFLNRVQGNKKHNHKKQKF